MPHERTVVDAGGAQTHVVSAGTGATTVVFVPGTNFNAAASLPLATALVAAGHRVSLLDVPGQPGLSSGGRDLCGGRLSWYGTWLDEVIDETSPGSVVVMGHSFGAAIALSGASRHIERLVLVSPGGLTGLRLPPACSPPRPRGSCGPLPGAAPGSCGPCSPPTTSPGNGWWSG